MEKYCSKLYKFYITHKLDAIINTILFTSFLFTALSIVVILAHPNRLLADNSNFITTEESKIKRVAIFPFEVISKEDSSFIGKGMGKMLCSRVASDTIQVKCIDNLPSNYGLTLNDLSIAGKTAGVAELNGVDYILVGTITIAGESVSSDARLIQVLIPEKVQFFSTTGKSIGDIVQHASDISEQVKAAIDGKHYKIKTENSSINSLSPPPLSQSKMAAPLKHNIDVLPKDSIILSSESSTLLNRKFDMQIRGIATADIDGDGRLDIAFMDAHTISFFSFENSNLVKKGEYNGPHYNNNIAIDSIDSNGNGKNELFITSIGKNNYLKSYVVEWDGRELQPLIKDSNWYFRVIQTNKTSKLIGQQRGHDESFSGSIYSLELIGKKIVKREQITTESFKADFTIFGFTTVNIPSPKGNDYIDNHQYYTWFDRSGFLNFGDSQGLKEEWKSAQSFGSTPLFIEQDRGRNNLKERRYINSRIFSSDIDSDGVIEIITVNNSDVAKGYLSGYRKFNQGSIEIMAWKENSMVDIWKSNYVTGYISDFNIIDMDGDNYPEIIYAAVMDSGLVMNKSQSTIFIKKIIDLSK